MEEKYIDSNDQVLTVEIDSLGTKHYFNSKGQYHRLDGPAIEYTNGSMYGWYKDGKYHRIGGPAYFDIIRNYCYEWWVDDEYVNYCRLKAAASYRSAVSCFAGLWSWQSQLI